MPTGSPVAFANATDRDLFLEVSKTLRDTRFAALQRIRCRVSNGIVELSGDVPSFYSKQIAQEVLLTLDDVHRIENRLHVRRSR
jgi:osmotically-inducible protein OsmY